jgi:glycogen operon protein
VEPASTATRCATPGAAARRAAACASWPTGCPARRTSTPRPVAPPAADQLRHRHDGFTLRDLTTYESKRNEANGEGTATASRTTARGTCGVEGETTDPRVNACVAQARNVLSTLLLSSGVPMLSMGDEVRRTQDGNNNAYCQDGPLSWMPWDRTPDVQDLLASPAARSRCARAPGCCAAHLLHRAAHLRRRGQGRRVVRPRRTRAHRGAVVGRALPTLAMYLDGQGIRSRSPRGQRVVDDSFLLVLHTAVADGSVTLPGAPWATAYDVVVDTTAEDGRAQRSLAPGAALTMSGMSVLLLRAHRWPAAH